MEVNSRPFTIFSQQLPDSKFAFRLCSKAAERPYISTCRTFDLWQHFLSSMSRSSSSSACTKMFIQWMSSPVDLGIQNMHSAQMDTDPIPRKSLATCGFVRHRWSVNFGNQCKNWNIEQPASATREIRIKITRRGAYENSEKLTCDGVMWSYGKNNIASYLASVDVLNCHRTINCTGHVRPFPNVSTGVEPWCIRISSPCRTVGCDVGFLVTGDGRSVYKNGPHRNSCLGKKLSANLMAA